VRQARLHLECQLLVWM